MNETNWPIIGRNISALALAFTFGGVAGFFMGASAATHQAAVEHLRGEYYRVCAEIHSQPLDRQAELKDIMGPSMRATESDFPDLRCPP